MGRVKVRNFARQSHFDLLFDFIHRIFVGSHQGNSSTGAHIGSGGAMRHIGVFLLTIIMAAAAATVDAATNSRLEGRVIDGQGDPLPGVQITIASESLIGGPQSTITDAAGGFTFSFLLVGDYTVDAALVGYTPATAKTTVRLDRTASVRLQLVPVTFESEIEVNAIVPIIDTTRTNTGEVYDETYLRNATVGSNNRAFYRIQDQAAGVAVPAKIFGATISDNTYLVDGFNTVDPTTGASATQFMYDAIEEASVLTGGMDAEFGFGTGGVMNVVTKSGGNSFSGTFDARYRDQGFNESGDRYDPDLDVSSTRIVGATLGGPILRDRLWFFAALENQRLESTPASAPETEIEDGKYFLGKLTWAISPNHRLAARYAATPRTIDYAGVAYDTSPEATHRVENDVPTAQLEYNGVLTDSLLLTVGLGVVRETLDAMPMVNDVETPPEFDFDSELVFSNPFWVELTDRDRDHHRAKLSYVVGETLGSHQFDGGLEYHELFSSEVNFTPGGYAIGYRNGEIWVPPFPDFDGDGLVDFYLSRDLPPETIRDPIDSAADGWSLFVQDQWRPVPELTLRLGLRYDALAHTNTVGETVADFEKWLPRLGVAWDVGGRGRQVVRAGWGRYAHPGVTSLSWFVPGVVRGYADYFGLEFLCGQFGICDRETAGMFIGPEFVHTDPSGVEHFFYNFDVFSQLPAETVDTLGVGGLRVPYRDELFLAYEVRLAKETSIELSYVQKKFHDQIEDTCNNNTWAWGDGEPPSLDDPSTWTDETGCTGSVRANMAGLRRDYEAVILRMASRAKSWFHLIGNYSYSKTRGNNYSQPWFGFGSGFGAFPGGDFDYFPTNFVNREGNLAEDFRHTIKVNGYLQFPLDFNLGLNAFYRTAEALSVIASCLDMAFPSEAGLAELEGLGIDYDQMVQYCQSPSSGTFFLEERGQRRGADLWQIDLQLTKGFRVGPTRLVLIASAFNVTSEEAPIWFVENPFDSRGWGAATQWQDPRRWELGFRIEF